MKAGAYAVYHLTGHTQTHLHTSSLSLSLSLSHPLRHAYTLASGITARQVPFAFTHSDANTITQAVHTYYRCTFELMLISSFTHTIKFRHTHFAITFGEKKFKPLLF